METMKYYTVIQQFIKAADMTTVALAEEARIFPEILKESIDTNSRMKIGNFISLSLAFLRIADKQPHKRDALRALYRDFYAAYLAEEPSEFRDIPNPYFVSRIEQLSEEAGAELHAQVRHILHPDEPETPPAPLPETSEYAAALNALLEQLNYAGRAEVLRRVEEMTYVPGYRKKT